MQKVTSGRYGCLESNSAMAKYAYRGDGQQSSTAVNGTTFKVSSASGASPSRATGHYRCGRQTASQETSLKIIYDKTANYLPELAVGEAIQMKPLPDDWTGIWRRGVCLRKVALQAYLVEVETTIYRRNRVDLRVAEPLPAQLPMASAKVFLPDNDEVQAQEGLSEAEVTRALAPRASLGSPQITHSATVPAFSSATPQSVAVPRYGRQIGPSTRLDL